MTPRPAPGWPEGLILFDGVCVLCSRWVAFVAARDRHGLFRFTPIQSPLGRRLARDLGVDLAEPDTNAVVVGGQAVFKSDAALAVLSRLPGFGSVRLLRLVPRRLRDAAYDRVARNRYRWFGRAEACLVPGPALRGRVLETADALGTTG